MKYVTVTLLALSIAACSSAKKTETTQQPPEKAPTTSAAPAVKSEVKATAAVTKKTSTSGAATLCKYEDITREVAVVENADRCAVMYTKDGEQKEIGSGLPKSAVCLSVAEKVKSNLESAGYKCE